MKKNSSSLIKLGLLSIGLLFTSSAFAADITYAVATGNWNDVANWSPQAPVAADNVIIPAGAIVTVSTDLSLVKFNKVAVNGKLIITAAGSLYLEQASTSTAIQIMDIAGGEVENGGSLTIMQTKANATTIPLQFSENATIDNKFTNTGTLLIDNTASSNTSSSGKCISFDQASVDRTSKMIFGGTMTFNSKTVARFIEVKTGAKVEFDGTAVIGSTSDYKNFRLMHFGSSATVTFAPTANITFYSGFVSSNGAITFSNSLAVTVTNKGKLSIFGGPTVTGYGLYLNPQFVTPNSGSSTFTNEGTLIINGNFPLGCIYLNGGTGTSATFNNQLGAVTSLINTSTGVTGVPIRASVTLATSLSNAGTLNLSSSAMDASIGTTFNTYANTGTVNFNVSTSVDKIQNFDGKIFANSQHIAISLASNEKAQMILTDVVGKIIKTASLQGEMNTISTSNLKGIYIVRIMTTSGSYSQKVVL